MLETLHLIFIRMKLRFMRVLNGTALFSIFISLSAFSQTRLIYPLLSQNGYRQLESLSAELISQCPPPHCLLVFPGRSSTLVMAFLESRAKNNFVGLPISGLRGSNKTDEELLTAFKNFETLSFSGTVSPKITNEIKELKIVDFVHHGNSLTTTSEWVQKILERENPKVKLSVISYGEGLRPAQLEKLQGEGIPVKAIPTIKPPSQTRGDLLKLIRDEEVEGYAPYSSWNPFNAKESAQVVRGQRTAFASNVKTKVTSSIASYDDLVEWFKKPDLREKLMNFNTFSCASDKMLQRVIPK